MLPAQMTPMVHRICWVDYRILAPIPGGKSSSSCRYSETHQREESIEGLMFWLLRGSALAPTLHKIPSLCPVSSRGMWAVKLVRQFGGFVCTKSTGGHPCHSGICDFRMKYIPIFSASEPGCL